MGHHTLRLLGCSNVILMTTSGVYFYRFLSGQDEGWAVVMACVRQFGNSEAASLNPESSLRRSAAMGQ